VIRLFVQDTTPPKVKYCVIVGNYGSVIATVFINTDLRIGNLDVELQCLQCPINPHDLGCLKYTSYVDCSEICERSKNDLNQILQKETGRKEGNIPEEKLQTIIGILKKAKTISTADKKKFWP
jgi:hypothetical protein